MYYFFYPLEKKRVFFLGTILNSDYKLINMQNDNDVINISFKEFALNNKIQTLTFYNPIKIPFSVFWGVPLSRDYRSISAYSPAFYHRKDNMVGFSVFPDETPIWSKHLHNILYLPTQTIVTQAMELM